MRAAARVAASSGWPSSASRGAADRSTSSSRALPRITRARPWTPRISAASGHRPPRRAYRTASRGMECRRYHSAARRCTSRIVRGSVIRARSTSAISRCSRYQRPPGPTACTNRFDAASSARVSAPVRCAGQGVGQVGGDEVDETDAHQEVEQLRGLPVDHLGQQVGGHRVVVTGERVDEPGGICAALQLQGGQPETGRPPLGPLDQATDVCVVEVDPELGQQRGGLVDPEGEFGGPDLGDHPGEAEPVQRPRRIPACRGHEPQPSRWAPHQP